MDNVKQFDSTRSLGAFDLDPNVGELLVYTTNAPNDFLSFERVRFDGVRIEGDNLCAETDHSRVIRVPVAHVLYWEFA